MHWRRKWQPTPVFLPGESQGRESLVGCRLWGRTESDTWDFSGKNIGVGCRFILQGIFPTQGSNPCLLLWQVDSLPLSHLESPISEIILDLICSLLFG